MEYNLERGVLLIITKNIKLYYDSLLLAQIMDQKKEQQDITKCINSIQYIDDQNALWRCTNMNNKINTKEITNKSDLGFILQIQDNHSMPQ